jgi:S1-C subfamily serine protease
LREAVVRVEVASDPLSFGPGLVEELSARHARTPYEQELLRRVRGVSTGSGFFVNARGDLVTNAHVVMAGIRYRNLHFTHQEWESMRRVLETAKEVWVQVGEGENARYYLAKLMAVAEDLDLAALRLTLPPQEKREFAFLPILRSDGLATGQPVTALGFPEDEYRASQGRVVSFISGLEVHGGMRYTWFPDPVTGEETILVSGTTPGPIGRFQHTAPTAHGNSGGPVVDSRGRVVGVAYALLSEVNGNGEPRTDLNLAIASNMLRGFLREHGIPFAEATGE